MDRLFFFRLDTREEIDQELYLHLELGDELLLISLANILLKYVLRPEVFLDQSFAFRTDKGAFHFLDEISNWSNLEILLVFDLSFLFSKFCTKRLVAKIKPLLGDSFILNLVDSFLHLPLLHEKKIQVLHVGIQPPFLFLRSVLFHFFLDDLDRNCCQDWVFARFYDQMLVPIETKNLKQLELLEIKNYAINAGVPLSILKPGDGKKVSCLSGSLFLNQYGKVEFDEMNQ